jgi:hypothetical protein|tara:strand:- start:58 stop:255 length:198 start_codon:yes stop_codon:yes gene_type:complete
MRNRNYFIQRLNSLQSKLGVIRHMVSSNESPVEIKKELEVMNDKIEDILTQIEREPLSGEELNRI